MSNNGNSNFKSIKSTCTSSALSPSLAAASLGASLAGTSLKMVDVNVDFSSAAVNDIVVLGEPVPAGSQVLLLSLDGGQNVATSAASLSLGFSFGSVETPNVPTVANFTNAHAGVTLPIAGASPSPENNTTINGGYVLTPTLVAQAVAASGAAAVSADTVFAAAQLVPVPTAPGIPVYPCLQVNVASTGGRATVNCKMLLATAKP